ncbi:MAG TPA: choice-of-anchor tandem repeat GloVer-containing protein [Candidatus Sulfotelmatobacter sp.]
MKKKGSAHILCVVLALAAICFSLPVSAHAQTESVIYSFPGGYPGNYAWGTPIFDKGGNLYGTAYEGAGCCGVVFKLAPLPGGKWRQTVLHGFAAGTYGSYVQAGLVQDAAGNIYGATNLGGDLSVYCYYPGCGVIFELSPTASGPWKETVLHKFTGGKDGGAPNGGLVIDSAGNLYGTTLLGGDTTACTNVIGNGCGVVFKLSNAGVSGWRETVLRTFTAGPGGVGPNGGLVFDGDGNLYGTAGGGADAKGVVFQLTPSSGGEWTEHVLHTFNNEGYPGAGVIFDKAGNLYGSTQDFAATCPASGDCGSVFELSPTSTGLWNETILHTFTGSSNGDGAYPHDLAFDATGNIYGTTEFGGLYTVDACDFDGCGTVFKLSPASDGSWNETMHYSFTGGTDGQRPLSGVAVDSSGNLFGETSLGGTPTAACGFACGVVFKITP